ncbi:MAG: hypothetical protein L3K18_03560 [Thermoplasmata archaeon]|nr:hypothetical protein [Thermoplasmata archaeon]
MKNQYFGDVNDYKKYGLLRQLGKEGARELAVCWALTNDDGRSDGSRIRYLEDPATWRRLDPQAFDFVKRQVLERGERSVDAFEATRLIPRCRFFGDLLPDDASSRDAYFARFLEEASGADLVFFDPDNGLGITKIERGKRGSSKYVYPCEIATAWERGHSILFYQHFPRQPREPFLTKLLDAVYGLTGLRMALFFVTSHVVFVLLPTPKHEHWLLTAAESFRKQWEGVVRLEIRDLLQSHSQPPLGPPPLTNPPPIEA